MATLAGQRAQFTWALNQYNLAETEAQREFYAARMARYILNAPLHGYLVEDVTQGQSYPADIIQHYISKPESLIPTDISEEQAQESLASIVDATNFVKIGSGESYVYAYGYACLPDRLKVGYTVGDVVQRIAAQIGTSTPDRPQLRLQIAINPHKQLERAIHSVLEIRGRKIIGGGNEWFKTNVQELLEIYNFIVESDKS